MSAKATIWAWAQPVANSTHRLVLLGIADMARDSGKVWASHAYIAAKIQMSERTVRDAIKALAADLLEVEDRPGKTAIIRLKLTPVMIYPDGPEPDEEDDTPAARSKTPANGSKTPAAAADEPILEPIQGTKTREEDLFSEPAGVAQDWAYPDIFLQAWALWPDTGKRRSSKAKSHQVWAKLRRQVAGQVVLINAITNYVHSPDATKDGGQYVPALDRWLRDGRWEAWDYVPTAPPTGRRIGLDDWQ